MTTTKRDEVEMAQAVEESESGNANLPMVKENTKVAISGGFNIEGLEDVPSSVIPVPFVRLVQGQSKNIKLENGSEATEGTFYFSDLRRSFERLIFIMLRAKHQIVEFEREEIVNGKKQMVKKPTKQ